MDARIVVDRRADALTLPTGALFRHGQAWAAFVVDAGRARLREVQAGPRGGTRTLVAGGLQTGEQVVVYPGEAVRDGVRVRSPFPATAIRSGSTGSRERVDGRRRAGVGTYGRSPVPELRGGIDGPSPASR